MQSKYSKGIVFLLSIGALNLDSLAMAADKAFLSADQVKTELKKFEKPSQLSGDFQQVKKIKDLDIRVESAGHFRVFRPQADQISVFWHVLKPEPMKICIEKNQIQLNDLTSKKKTNLKLSEIGPEDGSGMQKLVHLMKLDPNEIVQFFDVQKEARFVFQFIPKNKKDFSFQYAGIELDAKKNLKKIRIVEDNQDSLEVRFMHTQEKPLVKESSCLD